MKQTDKTIVKEFLQNTLKEIMSLSKADGGSLFLFDPINRELVLESIYNSVDLDIKGLRQRIGDGVSGKVAELNKPVLINNINNNTQFKSNGFKHYRTNSFICIPLSGKSTLLGLINITDKSTGEPFSQQDLEIAVSLTKYACIIVEYLLHSSKLSSEKEDLSKQNSLLEKYASVGKLAAGVVHEINNPLDGVIRFTNMLLDQVEEDTVTKDYLKEIKKGLDRITGITRSLLDFSHQVNSQGTLFKKYIDLHQSIDESIEILQNRMKGSINISKRYHKQKSRLIDQGIQHVFVNIIKNAIDAMPRGGNLDISTNINDSALEIDFKDSGIGIPKDIISQIFEPFFTTKSSDRGIGLGLSMCREIINRYEGDIKVSSNSHSGTTFRLIIPAKNFENNE